MLLLFARLFLSIGHGMPVLKYPTCFRVVICVFVGFVGACMLTGCGSECDDVSCDFGVCQEGACANPGSCEASVDCLPGYACDGGVCKSLTSCQNDLNCEVGVCRSGTCVNPDSCAGDRDCLERSYCADDGVCRPDPCNTFSCAQGECVRGTRQCQSRETCTPDSELQDCVDGEKCHDGTCLDEPALCEALDCQRGVCDFGARSCVNADRCEDNEGCLDGYYCNEAAECVEDLCVGVSCDDGGVCVSALGECENADPCDAQRDCVAGHVCVEGTCRLEDVACGDPGCAGNQRCEYDAQTLTASCAEPEQCETSLDCLGERHCGGAACLEPTACGDDAFEPNDADAEATDFLLHHSALALEGSICAGDTDVFTIDTRAIPNAGLRGTLVVTAEYGGRDIGLGELEMELVDPDGQLVDSSTSGRLGEDGSVEVRRSVTAANQGIYTVRLTDAGDVSTAGVDYTLSADLIRSDVASACANAEQISNGNVVVAHTDDGASDGLGSGCTEIHSSRHEHVYTFELTEASNVLLRLAPTDEASRADLTMAVRRSCERLVSEVGCVDATGAGEEVFEDVLPPGRYYVIVQTASGTNGGEFRLSQYTTPAACAREESRCVGEDRSEMCDEQDGFQIRTCEQACQPRTGLCVPEEGDTCRQARPIVGDYTETITWADYTNDLEMPAGSCVPHLNGYTDSDGADAVFEVTLDAGHSMLASLEPQTGDSALGGEVSLYLVDGCSGTAASCVDASNEPGDGAERLAFINDSGAAETVYLVADSAVGTTADALLDIQIGETICIPEASTCDANNDVVRCDIAGISESVEAVCHYGCTSGACDAPVNDTCSGARVLSEGQPITEPIGSFDDESDDTWQCAHAASSGADAFYKVVTTEDDRVVSVEVSAPFDVVAYALDACTDASRCAGEVDEAIGNETLHFYAPVAGEYFVGVDTADKSATGDITVEATISQPECTPGAIVGCAVSSAGELEYCNAAGLTETYGCTSGSCSSGWCDQPTGDECFEAMEVGTGGTFAGSYGQMGARLSPSSKETCELWEPPDGPEAVFAVDMSAGDIMRARLTSPTSSSSMYVLENCVLDPGDACMWGRSSVDELAFYAPEDGTYYLVVDNGYWVSDPFVIDIDVTSGGVCQPGGAVCDSATGTLSHCDELGSELRTSVQCAYGCSGQACNAPPSANDNCASAYSLGGAARIVDNWSRFGNLNDPGGYCNITDASGPEAVYSLDLAAGEVLTAELLSFDPVDYPRLYLSSGCSSVGNKCLAGAQSSGEPVKLSYRADTAETVYIFADSDSSQAVNDFLLDVDVQQTECQSGDTQCAGPNTLETCTSERIFEPSHCQFGCSSGSCDDPPNDDCSGALVVPNDGEWHAFAGSLDMYTSVYDLGQASSSCTGYDSPGPDAVYALDLTAGQVVQAEWRTPSNASVWITDDCATSPEDNCVAGYDNFNSSGSVTYTAPSDGRYYVVGDVGASSISGDFQMRIRAVTPECSPQNTSPSCTDAVTLKECVAPGLYQNTHCHFGCSNGSCDIQQNDTCQNAIDVSGGGLFPGDYANLSGDYDPTGNGCPGMNFEQRGPDAAYVATLQPNQSLTAEASSPSGTDVSVYIVTNCSDVANTCLAGSDSLVLSGAESVTYTASSTETIYIIVDTYSTSLSSGTYELDVTIK